MENPEFLKTKYNLHNTPEVKSAARRTEVRSGEKVSQKTADQIANYLNRFQEIIDRQDDGEREMGINALKKVLTDKFVTKYEDIPKNWHDLNERILRERGGGGDWNKYSEENKEIARWEQSEAVLADQEASLEQWVDYLASPVSNYMPDEIKYWTFRNITELSEFDKDKSEFPKRSKGTVKMFPDINHEALAYVIDAVLKKQNNEDFKFDRFEADLSETQKEQFKQSLKDESFSRLYAWANEQIHPIAKHLLPITEGKWIKYEQDDENSDNYKKLVESIRGRGTGWCTAGESTAKTQLQGGAFHCYYTEDDEKQAIIPRIAIRMDGDNIGEVRGIAYKQNLDPYMGDVLASKLDEFPDKEEYLKKDADMKQLTEIDNKVIAGQDLNKDDLIFIYEINDKITGFGYEPDPRVEEIRATRNPQEDAPIVLDCQPQEIVRSQAEYEGSIKNKQIIKAYIGPLFPGIFKLNLEHIYASFPEGRIEKFQMTLGERNKDELINELNEKKESDNLKDKIFISDSATHILTKPEFETLKKKEVADLVKLKVADLGFSSASTVEKVFEKAEELGLELCPPEVGPILRLDFRQIFNREQTKKDYFRIGMKQIHDSLSGPIVFSVSRKGVGQAWLSFDWASSARRWDQGDELVFRVSKLET